MPYWKQVVSKQNEFRISSIQPNEEQLANIYTDGEKYTVDKERWLMEPADEGEGENWSRMWYEVANFSTYKEAEAFVKRETGLTPRQRRT